MKDYLIIISIFITAILSALLLGKFVEATGGFKERPCNEYRNISVRHLPSRCKDYMFYPLRSNPQ